VSNARTARDVKFNHADDQAAANHPTITRDPIRRSGPSVGSSPNRELTLPSLVLSEAVLVLVIVIDVGIIPCRGLVHAIGPHGQPG